MNRQTLLLFMNKCIAYALNIAIVLGILSLIIGFIYSMKLFINS